MSRSLLLFTGDPGPTLSCSRNSRRLVQEWGYAGVELCCWGGHFDVAKAEASENYGQARLDLLSKHDLQLGVLANHRAGQAICDRIEPRHRRILPDRIWADGDPAGIQIRAAEEMIATITAAQKLGIGVVSGFTGSGLWAGVSGWPANPPEVVEAGLRDFAERWNPILDAAASAGVRFAAEVHPGQIAFDITSAERALDVLDGREEFGFNFDPSHLHIQGIDPAEFVRRFADRIYHVHIKDAALRLGGRNGLLNGYLALGDSRRGWDFRAPGHGGVDWEGVIRAASDAQYARSRSRSRSAIPSTAILRPQSGGLRQAATIPSPTTSSSVSARWIPTSISASNGTTRSRSTRSQA